MLKTLHVALAFLSITGFVLRAGWAFTAPDLLRQKWVRIAPHVVDTLLLGLGIALALSLPGGLSNGWLVAKLVALVAYIGFGVLTLRGSGAARIAGLTGALCAAAYIFVVAYTRQAWPL